VARKFKAPTVRSNKRTRAATYAADQASSLSPQQADFNEEASCNMEKVLTKKIDAKQEAIERHAVGDRKIHGKDLDRNESPDGDERSEDEDFSGNEDFPQHSEKNWDREYSDESDDCLLRNGTSSTEEKQTLQTTWVTRMTLKLQMLRAIKMGTRPDVLRGNWYSIPKPHQKLLIYWLSLHTSQ